MQTNSKGQLTMLESNPTPPDSDTDSTSTVASDSTSSTASDVSSHSENGDGCRFFQDKTNQCMAIGYSISAVFLAIGLFCLISGLKETNTYSRKFGLIFGATLNMLLSLGSATITYQYINIDTENEGDIPHRIGPAPHQ